MSLLEVAPEAPKFTWAFKELPLSALTQRSEPAPTLWASIQKRGILKPPVVRSLPGVSGLYYYTLDGRQRLGAAEKLGLQKIWCQELLHADARTVSEIGLLLAEGHNAVQAYIWAQVLMTQAPLEVACQEIGLNPRKVQWMGDLALLNQGLRDAFLTQKLGKKAALAAGRLSKKDQSHLATEWNWEEPMPLSHVQSIARKAQLQAQAAAPPLPLEVIQPPPSHRQQLLEEILADLEQACGDETSLVALKLRVSTNYQRLKTLL